MLNSSPKFAYNLLFPLHNTVRIFLVIKDSLET